MHEDTQGGADWSRGSRLGLAIALALLAGVEPAFGAICQWTGGGTTAKWSDGPNWMNCNPDGPHSGDTLYFLDGAKSHSTNDNTTELSLANITFQDNPGDGFAWQLDGAALRVMAGGRIRVQSGPAAMSPGVAATIDVHITLDGDVDVQNIGSGTVGGTLHLASFDLNGHVLTFGYAFPIEVHGVIAGPPAGGVRVEGTGAGDLALDAENTYQGTTVIDNSTVTIRSGHPFGPGNIGSLTVIPGSGLVLRFSNDNVILPGITVVTTPSAADLRLFPPLGTVTIVGHTEFVGRPGNIIKRGNGTLIFANRSGTPDQWGRLFVQDAGSVQLGVPQAIPDGAFVDLSLDGTLDLHGFSETIDTLSTSSGRGVIQLASGTLTVKNGGSLHGMINGPGTFVLTGGTFDFVAQTTATATMTVVGGTLKLNAGGPAIFGPLVINGGSVVANQGGQFDPAAPVTVNGPGSLDLSVQSVQRPTAIGSLAGTGDVGLGTQSLTIGANNRSTTYDGLITGAGLLTKTGTGTLSLTSTGVSTAAEVRIVGGTLAVDGTLSVAGPVTLGGGILAGNGTVNAAGNIVGPPGGVISPGNGGPGILHVGTVTTTSLKLIVELNGPNPGKGGYDQLALTGNLTLGASSTLQATLGFEPPKGATFTIASLAPGMRLIGTFDGLPEDAVFPIGDRHFRISYRGGKGNDLVLTATDDPPAPRGRTYYLSEGATGGFFDEDVLIANPNDTEGPVTLTFSKETGEQVVATRMLPPQSHLTVHVDQLQGLENTAASAQVTSESGQPLIVERSMFWDASYYAGHTGSAIDVPAQDWLFAEGSQGFFETFVLVINPNPTPTDVTFTFFLEQDAPVVKTYTVGKTTRLTLHAGDLPELVNRSFGIAVHATQPIMAERSMYFGRPGRALSGGTESAGVTAPSTHWFLAEGATGDFFMTFVLVSNPNSTPAHVTLQYLLDTGETIRVPKTVPAHTRLTTNVGGEEDSRLHNAAMSTVVTSDVPIIAERSMYWPGLPWAEGHNSFGVVDAGVKWGLSEGRCGGPLNFHTYILLANPQTTAATVTVTYLRDAPAAPVVKTYTVAPTSRFNIDTGSVPELHDESFGAVIEVTNQVPIIVEQSMYWDPTGGNAFVGGTNATGIPLSENTRAGSHASR